MTPDDDLVAAFTSWWVKLPYLMSEDDSRTRAAAVADDLASLQEHLAAHGFAIVRRMANGLPAVNDPPSLRKSS